MAQEEFGNGSAAFSLTPNIPWPPKSDFRSETSSSDGRSTITIDLKTDGMIHVTITGESGTQHKLVSPTILRPEPTTIKFAFRWNEDDASLAVAGKVVASTKEALGSGPITVKPVEWSPDQGVQEALLEQAEATRKKRTVKEQGKKAEGTDRLRSLEENLIILGQRRLALRELMEAAKEGRDHHLYGISAALRLMICNGGSNFHPLVQRVAGLLDQPLFVYGYPPKVHEDSFVVGLASSEADYSFVWFEAGQYLYKIDLDDWLEAPGFCYKGKLETNNKFLRLFADKDGSHHDPCVSAAFDFWNDIVKPDSHNRRDSLLRTSAVVVTLAGQLLEAAKEQGYLPD
ncbi:MAG: hypothetical protein ACSHXW_10130 [Yoonia sp.]